MRAQEIYEKLIAGRLDTWPNHFPQPGVIQNIQQLRTNLEHVSGIPGFSQDESLLRASIIFRTTSAQVSIQGPEWTPLQSSVVNYGTRLSGVRTYFQAIIQSQDPKSVYLKLPDSSSFGEIIQFQSKFLKCLEQVILNPSIGGELNIKSWEGGSFWIELSVKTEAAVITVGSLAWAAAVVLKKIQEGRMFSEYVNGLKPKNEHLQNLVEAEKEMLKSLVDTEARNIAFQQLQGGEVSPDTIERIKFSIKELSELIEKGAEIHAALQAPENAKNVFPNFKQLSTIESRTKLIEEGKKQNM